MTDPFFPPVVPPVSTTTLATFTASIQEEIARGTSVAARLPTWIRSSAQWLEQNFTFNHMKKTGLITLPANASSLTFPSYLLKDILSIRPIIGSQSPGVVLGHPIKQVPADDVTSIDPSQLPAGWFRYGMVLSFDIVPPLAQNFAVLYSEYTSWPLVGSTQPVLLLRYENLMRAQTMMTAWRALKDFESMQVWKAERDEALRAVLVAEDEANWLGQNMRMAPS